MAESKNTAGWKFYNEQTDYLLRKDIEGLIDNHYNRDALLIAFDFTVRGSDALKKHFVDYLNNLGSLKVKSTDRFTETEDSIFFEATVETGRYGEVKVYDALVLKNGKISYHFTGVR